ncbi:MAG: indole-3-glycerol phosphate synthase TrpC [Acetivibrionales bacterium]|jgi:indole-3-glycerol phosphate synthase
MILDDIVCKKKKRLQEELMRTGIEAWKQRIMRAGLHKPVDFAKALKRGEKLAIIAEIKKASPSAGIIRKCFDPAAVAAEYAMSGVQAISVLTEKDFFMGDDSDLVKVRQTVPVPVLRKDFIIDLRQVYQSRYLGADAILLIVSILDNETLKKMMIVADILGMHCLVEVHDEAELERALNAGAKIIGINNRNLKTFEVDLTTTERLINKVPIDKIVVSESGIKTADDMRYLKNLGVDAVLIGESLMRAGSVADKIEELMLA